MRPSPRHGTTTLTRRLVAEAPCDDGQSQRHEKPGEDQREVAGTHPQRRADLEPDRAQAEHERRSR